jgi:peptidoglycan/LPS O-acetylase OafA/YrhL
VLAATGAWGALLTVVILAMSVLLRLGTQGQGEGAISMLPAGMERGARIAHRIAAMGVGVLAAVALVAAWRGGRGKAMPAAIAGLTLMLALIGRYTPGYRFDLVTVLNMAGGVALAAAFWALRPRASTRPDPVALIALGLLVVLAVAGAAADASAMRGSRDFGPLHVWMAAAFGCFALVAAWRSRMRRWLAAATASLTVAQIAVGLAILASGELRPLALGWVHAMAACVLALLLVSLAFGRPGEELA